MFRSPSTRSSTIGGSDAQKEKYYRSSPREWIGCFRSPSRRQAATPRMRTSARRDGDTWFLNGPRTSSPWIALNLAVVFAQTDPAQKRKGDRGVSSSRRGDTGFSVGKLEQKLGIRGSDTAAAHLSGRARACRESAWRK